MAMAKKKPAPALPKGEVVRLVATHNLAGPGRFRFRIGLNEVVRSEFDAMLSEIQKKDPDGLPRQLMAFERLFSDGLLSFATDEPEIAPVASSGPTTSASAPSGLPADEAAALKAASECNDSAQLEAWFAAEKRASVSDAIVARLKELDASK
jgi:hypothetical protein